MLFLPDFRAEEKVKLGKLQITKAFVTGTSCSVRLGQLQELMPGQKPPRHDRQPAAPDEDETVALAREFDRAAFLKIVTGVEQGCIESCLGSAEVAESVDSDFAIRAEFGGSGNVAVVL